MKKRTERIPCNGISQKTGKRVGSRHRWNGGTCCIWCGKFLDQVTRLQTPVETK